MPFRFRLYNPPCDVTFLSLVDGEALYNADGARTRDVKEATIRQLGWHHVELPPDWFLSRQALDTIRQLLEAMQCTVQYLKYCGKNEERKTQKAIAELRRCEDERAAAFEELIESRETLASYKRQLRELGEERQRARSSRWRAPIAGNEWMSRLGEMEDIARQLPCCFCANVYPSRHALESHMRKRHKRPERYAAVAVASDFGSVKQRKKQYQLDATTRAPVSAHRASSDLFCEGDVPLILPKPDNRCGDRSLREQISELRLAVAKLTEQQAELHRSLSSSHLAAERQQAARKAVTTANPLSAGEPATEGVAVTSTDPLPELPPRDSKPSEEDLLLRIHRELLHTSTQLQQLQSAVDKENVQQAQSATDDSGSFTLRGNLSQSHQRHQPRDPLAAPLGARAAPPPNPQITLHPSSCTESGDMGVTARQRRSEGDSLVIVSTVTPPASVTAEPHHTHSTRENATAAPEQKRMQAVLPTLSESQCGTNSGLGSFVEAQRPASVIGNMSVSTTSVLGLPFSSRSGDSAGAAHRHGVLTPQSAPHGSLKDSGNSTGDRSPSSLDIAISGVHGKKTAPPSTGSPERALPIFSFQSHLPWMGAESATARFGTADVMSANRYGSALTEGAPPWMSGHLPAATEEKAQAPQIVLPGFTRADATLSSHLTPAEMSTNATSALIVPTFAVAPQPRDSLESGAATALREAFQQFGSTTQLGPTELGAVHIVPTQREVAPAEGLSSSHLPPHQQTPLMTHSTLMPPRTVPDNAVADADRPPCSTSPLMGRATQRSQAEAYDHVAVGAAVRKDSGHGDLRGGLPCGSQPLVERFPHTLADAGQIAGGAAEKIVPVVYLVPPALSGSGKRLPQDLPEQKRNDLLSGAPAASAVLLPSPLGLNDSSQQRRSGDEDGSESKADAKNSESCSIGLPGGGTLKQHDVGDGLLSSPLETKMREERKVVVDGPGDSVMEDLEGDTLAGVTSYAAERERATRAASFGAPREGNNVDSSRFAIHDIAAPMVGGERTPSQADSRTSESQYSDYYYYTYPCSDEEGAVSDDEGAAIKPRGDNGGQETQRASAFLPGAAVGLSASASRTVVTPLRHTAEALKFQEADVPQRNAGDALSEKKKTSHYSLQSYARQSANQQAAPAQQQQPPARAHVGVKQPNSEVFNVAWHRSSQRSASAPQQTLRKTKGFFAKLFSKKER